MSDEERFEPPPVATIPRIDGARPEAPCNHEWAAVNGTVQCLRCGKNQADAAQPEPRPFGAPREQEPVDAEVEALANAAALVERFKKEKGELQAMVTEATLGLESRNRRIAGLEADLAEARNNLQALQSQVEDLRQNNADLRAFFGEQRGLIAHLMARYDHFEIPLPPRKRVKRNGTVEAAGSPVEAANAEIVRQMKEQQGSKS